MTRIFFLGLCLFQTATAQLTRTLDSLLEPVFKIGSIILYGV